MAKCSFCEEIKFYLALDKWQADVDLYHAYTAALVQTTIYKGENRGRTVCYKKNGVGFPMKFCPECGKKLDGELHG